MPIARVNDLDVAYDDVGSGPPLLFVMGFTASRFQWLGFDKRFADAHRVVSLDNRGVGESGAPRGPYSMEQMASDALGLLDVLGIERVSVVGVSMGGMIALQMALAAPSRIDRLVLGCTHAGGGLALPPSPEALASFTGAGRGPLRDGVQRLIEVNLGARFVREHPETVERLVEHGMTHRMHLNGLLGQLAAMSSHDVDARLPALRAPTAILSGDADQVVPVGNSHRLAARIEGARLLILEGVGHMFWVEQPGRVEHEIRAFLATNPIAG